MFGKYYYDDENIKIISDDENIKQIIEEIMKQNYEMIDYNKPGEICCNKLYKITYNNIKIRITKLVINKEKYIYSLYLYINDIIICQIDLENYNYDIIETTESNSILFDVWFKLPDKLPDWTADILI